MPLQLTGHIRHVKKKGPLTTVKILLPVTDGSLRTNGKQACFYPVIFQSWLIKSLSF
jgi:hypothetical protein